MSYQKITLIGRLGRDPELRATSSGTTVVSFSLATDRRYKGESETTWWRCTAFGKTGEVIQQHLRKGDPILVECRVSSDRETGGPRVWTDKTGTARASWEVIVETFSFLPRASDGGQSGGYSAPRQQPQQQTTSHQSAGSSYGGEPDEMPF